MIETALRSVTAFESLHKQSLHKQLPADFPESVFTAIGEGIERHAKVFLNGFALLDA